MGYRTSEVYDFCLAHPCKRVPYKVASSRRANPFTVMWIVTPEQTGQFQAGQDSTSATLTTTKICSPANWTARFWIPVAGAEMLQQQKNMQNICV